MTTNRVAILRESVKRIVQILAERDITVRQEGSKARVDYHPRTHEPVAVIIPFIPDNAPEELIDAVQGFIDHEVGHLLNSDFKLLAQNEGTMLGDLHNMIEDTFVERQMNERFAGSKHNFRSVYKTYSQRVLDRQLAEAKSPQEKMGILTGAAIRAWAGQDFFVEYMKDKWDLMKPMTDKLPASVIEKFATTQSTQDCLDLAKIVQKASQQKEQSKGDKGDKKEQGGKGGKPGGKGENSKGSSGGKSGGDKSEPSEKPEKSEKPKKDKGEEGKSDSPDSEKDDEPEEKEGDSESDEGKDKSEGEDESTEGEDEGKPESESDSEDDAEGKDDGEGKDDAEGESDSKPGDSDEGDDDEGEVEDLDESPETIEVNVADFENALKGAKDFSSSMVQWISETTVDLQKDADYLVFTTDYDKVEPYVVPASFNSRYVEELEDKVNHMVGPIQKDLERAIVAHSRSFWQPGRRSGRLHSANLSRLRFNDDRVFRQREEHTCKDTAIELVIDLSGSMLGAGKIDVASQAAYALSMTLDRMQIAHEVIGFTTYGMHGSEMSKLNARMEEELKRLKRAQYSRQDFLMMPVIKGFDERITTEHKRRFAALPKHRGNQSFHNNVDGESIEIAARRLAKRKESRKVMIVLSDGAPAAYGNNHELAVHTKRVIQSIEKSQGMEIVGIGIMSSAVKQFYTRHVMLDNIDELPAVVMGQLKHALLHA